MANALLFNPNCPCCVQEMGLNGVPPAPSSGHRHPESDASESARKDLTQCQYCFKSRGSGITLQKCAACKVDMYCSKECQRKAWPAHKVKCQINRRLNERPGQGSALAALRAFTSKHRPTVAEAGILSLNLWDDPSRASRDVLTIFVRSRPESKRVETSFYVTGADVVPIRSFGPASSDEMREQRKIFAEENRRCGRMGAILVVLNCVDTGVSNIAPVGFGEGIFGMSSAKPWKEWMMHRLNEGIVS